MSAGRKTRLRVLRGFDIPDNQHAPAALRTLIRIFGRLNDASTRLVKQFDLTLPHFEVLLSLKRGEGISQQDLSEQLLLTKGNICVILQKMESTGLIQRRVDPTDQRVHRLFLTDDGRLLLARMMPGHHDLLIKIMSALNSTEQKTFYDLLTRIDQNFDDLEL